MASVWFGSMVMGFVKRHLDFSTKCHRERIDPNKFTYCILLLDMAFIELVKKTESIILAIFSIKKSKKSLQLMHLCGVYRDTNSV